MVSWLVCKCTAPALRQPDSLTGHTHSCFLVKLHLPQRCHRGEMRCSDQQGWLENVIIVQLWNTNCLWLLVIHSVAMENSLSLYYLPSSSRTRCHPHEINKYLLFQFTILYTSTSPLIKCWSCWWDQSAQTRASECAHAGVSVREWNDLLNKPLFISDNMQSGYFSINGHSRWKAFIDVDSHTF